MTDFEEAFGLITIYEKCIGHGESLKGIKDAAWKRLLEINADLMEPPAPHVAPVAQTEPPMLKAEPQPEPVVEPIHEETPGEPVSEPTPTPVLERKL